MELVSNNGVEVFAERSIYWSVNGANRAGGSDDNGSTELSSEWFLAEGSTSNGRETNILIGNPNAVDSELDVQYLIEGREPVLRQYSARAHSRLTIRAGDDVPDSEFSTRIVSTNEVPVVVERSMFGEADGQLRKWGHTALGVTGGAAKWYLAEGAVHNRFETFILIANPNNHEVTVNLRFLLSDGEPVEKQIRVSANTRKTINVELSFAEMRDQAGFSTVVSTENGEKIVVERAMYWTGESYSQRSGATAVVGIPAPQPRWILPEGAVGGSSGFECFVLIGNPEDEAAEVDVTYVLPDGLTITRPQVIPAGRRLTLKVNNEVSAEAGTQSVSTLVESTNGVNVIVERAMYWNGRTEGHAGLGISR
jgi:hypothetical protein